MRERWKSYARRIELEEGSSEERWESRKRKRGGGKEGGGGILWEAEGRGKIESLVRNEV